jgi:hypothetical protein
MAATRTPARRRNHVEGPEVEKVETLEVEETETDEILNEDPEVEDDEDEDEDDEDEVDDKVETKTEATKPTPVSPVTPFQACKRVNAALAAAGTGTQIQAPMLYTYAAKGKFKTRPATKITQKGIAKSVVEIDEESFTAWMTEYIASVVAKTVGRRQLQKVVDTEATKVDVAEGHEDDGVTTDEIEASEAE